MALTGVVYNRFPAIAARLKPTCQGIVTRTTLYTRDAVQSLAPVDSGFMQGAVYAVTPDGTSTYGQGIAPPTDDAYLLPEVRPDNDTTGIVGAAANYSIFVNNGTRFMGAQPFFDQGVEDGRAYGR